MMRQEKINLWERQEYHYADAFGFRPVMDLYLHEGEDEADAKRPCVLIAPGGGYRLVSPTEGELVALEFYRRGYQAAVLTYTTDILERTPLKDQPLRDMARAVAALRLHADEWKIEENRIALLGFSAGAHLCGMLGVHYADVEQIMGMKKNSLRPDALIMCYPVITTGQYGHQGTFRVLLGADASEEELEYNSLEKQVHPDMPPCFIWQMQEDQTVPVENSLLFEAALQKQKVPFACHIFPKGSHGLSLANREWAEGNYGSHDVLEQVYRIREAYDEGELDLTEKEAETVAPFIRGSHFGGDNRGREDAEAALWPEMADIWMKKMGV